MPFSFRRAPVLAAAMVALCLTFPARPAAAFTEGLTYATVRGWTVMQSDKGCSAFTPQVPVIFNIPPAGGWQLIFPYNIPEDAGDVYGVVDVDKFSFDDTFYGDGTYYYGSFPLAMRKTVGQGSRLSAQIGTMTWDTSLSGSTAALLKLEECWQRLSGWTTASSRAGTFAFSGD